MSDTPQGPGWWQASDSKWYPPQAAPVAPPPGYGAPGPGQQPGSGPPPYGGVPGPGPLPPGGAESTGSSRTVWIVLASIVGLLVVVCGGCGLVFYLGARDAVEDVAEIAEELAIDFTSGVPADGPSSCTVTGSQTTGGYEVEVQITNASGVDSHYRISYDLADPAGNVLGSDFGIISDVPAGDEVRDTNLGFVTDEIDASEVTCTVTEALRVPA